MNPMRAEKAVQLISIAGIWLAFVAVWYAAPGYMFLLREIGASPPCAPFSWPAVAQSSLSFVVPAILTFTIAWLMKTRSRHANWAAGVVLATALLHVIASHVTFVLPAFSLCREL